MPFWPDGQYGSSFELERPIVGGQSTFKGVQNKFLNRVFRVSFHTEHTRCAEKAQTQLHVRSSALFHTDYLTKEDFSFGDCVCGGI